jgi:hypothetical protein
LLVPAGLPAAQSETKIIINLTPRIINYFSVFLQAVFSDKISLAAPLEMNPFRTQVWVRQGF